MAGQNAGTVMQTPIREFGSEAPQAVDQNGDVLPFGQFDVLRGQAYCIKRIEGHLLRNGANPADQAGQLVIRQVGAPLTIVAVLSFNSHGEAVTTGAQGAMHTGRLIPVDTNNDRQFEIAGRNFFPVDSSLVHGVARAESYVQDPAAADAAVVPASPAIS